MEFQSSNPQKPYRAIKQKTDRPEQECQDQARHHCQVRDTMLLRVAYLPASYEEIEREVAHPAGE